MGELVGKNRATYQNGEIIIKPAPAQKVIAARDSKVRQNDFVKKIGTEIADRI
ncbi:hypothetical protein [Rickettsiales endosymbiont of Stachyamoeba lipophora]|uniref:hypothetical protein n=1 Tax=Rickettsiales endosymbiont of Stachyamoeba lipophora TaxID=2486578 RepID=UPI0013DDD25E|nr:hypothetical protein [Rickettsiales endosymbiont of Stachyamoeba lipophora]